MRMKLKAMITICSNLNLLNKTKILKDKEPPRFNMKIPKIKSFLEFKAMKHRDHRLSNNRIDPK